MGQPTINFILAVFVLPMVVNLMGCGMVTAPIKGASVEANEEVSIQEPLLISKSRARALKTIAVAVATAPKGDDDKRTQKIGLEVLTTELKKTKRFIVIPPNIFRQKAAQLNLVQDLAIMSQSEIEEESAQIAKALQAQGVVLLGSRAGKVAMGGAMMSTMFKGTITAPFVMLLDVVESSSKEPIYRQELPVQLITGGMGIKNTTDQELREMMIPTIKPLVADLVTSFN